MRCNNILPTEADIITSVPQSCLPDVHAMLSNGLVPQTALQPSMFNSIPLEHVGTRVRDVFDAIDAKAAIGEMSNAGSADE